MSDYRFILFDLDGTLTDPCEGITNSVLYALNKMDIKVENKEVLKKFIGPPLLESFKNFYGFSEEQSMKALLYYREYFKDKGMLENFVYNGMADVLKNLTERGKRLCVATSKPEPFAEKILEHFNLTRYFEFIAGSNLDGTRAKKNEVIEYALEKCKITDRTAVVMVGDREHDILGAKKCSVDSIGVLFGYGSREELENAGATYIAEAVEDIAKIALQSSTAG